MARLTRIQNIKRVARETCGERSNLPVDIVYGSDRAPEVYGHGWHYETRGGQVIHHPSAYSKKGFSNMIYCPSTRHIIVGDQWPGDWWSLMVAEIADAISEEE
jgi:hypothetical protein